MPVVALRELHPVGHVQTVELGVRQHLLGIAGK